MTIRRTIRNWIVLQQLRISWMISDLKWHLYHKRQFEKKMLGENKNGKNGK